MNRLKAVLELLAIWVNLIIPWTSYSPKPLSDKPILATTSLSYTFEILLSSVGHLRVNILS